MKYITYFIWTWSFIFSIPPQEHDEHDSWKLFNSSKSIFNLVEYVSIELFLI